MDKYDPSVIEVGDWIEIQHEAMNITRYEIGIITKVSRVNDVEIKFQNRTGRLTDSTWMKKVNKEFIAQSIMSTDDTYSDSLLKQYNNMIRNMRI